MAAVQELLKSNISDGQKYTTILDFDRVLGLDLDNLDQPEDLPSEVQKLVDDRQKARDAKEWGLLTACAMRSRPWAIWFRIHPKG